MKLLLENWRQYINESKLRVFDFDDTIVKWLEKIKASQKAINGDVGYHLSSVPFDNFDNSRLGSNTAMGAAGKGMYNLDSYLGHMFVPDPNLLLPHKDKLNGRYMFAVTLRPGKVAVVDVRDFKKWFGKNDPNAEARVREFGQWLKKNGFGGVHYINPELKGKLMADTIQVFDAANTNIRSIMDLETNKRIQTKDLQGQSFADAFGVK
jgi:hypothetical protein